MSTRKLITSQIIVLRNQDRPEETYLTAEGVAAFYQELTGLPRRVSTKTIVQWTTRGKITPVGYLGGVVPLYDMAGVRALRDGRRRIDRRLRRASATGAPWDSEPVQANATPDKEEPPTA